MRRNIRRIAIILLGMALAVPTGSFVWGEEIQKEAVSETTAGKESEAETAKESDVEAAAEEALSEENVDAEYPDLLACYSSWYEGTEERATNVRLAAEACNGVVLAPGETFSYNETLGERTEERGYKSAVQYAAGQITEGIGGGICQVSSTLYCAALYADLEITNRVNHSRRVEYVPCGMDAAVSWGTLDFCFRNNTEYPIKIEAEYKDDTVFIRLLGTKTFDHSVVISVEKIDDLHYKTFKERYDSDGNLISSAQVSASNYMA